MGQTLQVKRNQSSRPIEATELVYSPDDGGYYLSQQNFRNRKSRTSVVIYSCEEDAIASWNSGKVKWEKWS